jgi:uncharacterized protein YwlG (UPF0340 family)
LTASLSVLVYPFAIIALSASGVKGVCASAAASVKLPATILSFTSCKALVRYSLLSESTYNSAGYPPAAAAPAPAPAGATATAAFSNKRRKPLISSAAIY